MSRTKTTLGSVVLGGLLCACPALAGDLYFEQTVTTALDREPRARVVSRIWHSGRRMRVETGAAESGQALILRLDTAQAWRLDLGSRTVEALELDSLRARSHLELSVASDLMGGTESGSARTVPLEQQRVLAGHSCRGFRVSSRNVVMDLFVTDELDMGVDAFARLLEWSGADSALPGILEELRRLPGFPLQTRSRVTVGENTHETLATVTQVRHGPIPPELFEPPADFEWLEGPPGTTE